MSISLSTLTSFGVITTVNGGTGVSSPGVAGNLLTSNGTGWATTSPSNALSGSGLTAVFIGSSSSGTTTVNYNLDVLQNITAHANVTAYYSSDKRLKENITPIQDPLNKILKLSGNTFKWSAEHYATQNHQLVKEHDVGVVAQEVLAVLPEAVHERDDGFLAVDYTKLIPLLIECIKAQQLQIDELRGNK